MLNNLSIKFKEKVFLLSSVKAVLFFKILIHVFEFVEPTELLHCPLLCSCYTVRKNEQDFPPTYTKVPSIGNCTYTVVNCERKQLSTFPVGMRRDTAMLLLDYNRIQHLNQSMMKGLEELQVLSITHNNLLSIANDTFNDLPLLEQLDLSYNQMRRIPRGLLCPWYRRGSGGDPEISGCNGWITAQTRLHLTMNHNPWHCNCILQQIKEQSACTTFEEPSCIILGMDKQDPIGYCMSPIAMRGVEIRRLSKKKDYINVCENRQSYVDVPLLITIFTWMGVVLGYVVYFISWNNKDIANHRSYLSTLNFQNRSRIVDPNRKQHSPLITQEDHEPSTTTDQKTIRPQDETASHHHIKSHIKTQTSFEYTNSNNAHDVWIPRSYAESNILDEKECLNTARNSNVKPKNRITEQSEVILRPSAPPTDTVFRLSSL